MIFLTLKLFLNHFDFYLRRQRPCIYRQGPAYPIGGIEGMIGASTTNSLRQQLQRRNVLNELQRRLAPERASWRSKQCPANYKNRSTHKSFAHLRRVQAWMKYYENNKITIAKLGPLKSKV